MVDDSSGDFVKWAQEQEKEATLAAAREKKVRSILAPVLVTLVDMAISSVGEWAASKGVDKWLEVRRGLLSSPPDRIVALWPEFDTDGICNRNYIVASITIPGRPSNCMRITIDLPCKGDYFKFYYKSTILKHSVGAVETTRQLRITSIDNLDVESFSTHFNAIIIVLINEFLKETMK